MISVLKVSFRVHPRLPVYFTDLELIIGWAGLSHFFEEKGDSFLRPSLTILKRPIGCKLPVPLNLPPDFHLY